jgi:hypothetical protein
VTPEEALRLKSVHIENGALSLDLYIMLRTFGAVVGRQGAGLRGSRAAAASS